MINVAICDDDIATTGKIEEMLCGIAKKCFIPAETEVFWDGKNLADAVEGGSSAGLLITKRSSSS